MNLAARKRSHAGRDEYVTGSHPHPRTYKRKIQSFTTRSVSHQRHKRDHVFPRHDVSHPESEEVEEDEEIEAKVAQRASHATEDDEEEEADDGDGAMPLVVFQCITCRSIFGDSYAFVCSTEHLWLVTLSHVTNVSVAPEVQTASKGMDAGSSYYELLCQNCQAVLGRKYLTTPVPLDGIRDLYSFATEAITSYTLGDPMQLAEGTGHPTMQRAAEACHSAVKKLAAESSEVAKLRNEMEKVKGLMVAVDERLGLLEEVNFDSGRTKT